MIFEVYRARRGLLRRNQWRWRLKAANHLVVATSGEGYNNKQDCIVAAQMVREEAAGSPITVLENFPS